MWESIASIRFSREARSRHRIAKLCTPTIWAASYPSSSSFGSMPHIVANAHFTFCELSLPGAAVGRRLTTCLVRARVESMLFVPNIRSRLMVILSVDSSTPAISSLFGSDAGSDSEREESFEDISGW